MSVSLRVQTVVSRDGRVRIGRKICWRCRPPRIVRFICSIRVLGETDVRRVSSAVRYVFSYIAYSTVELTMRFES